MAPMLTEDLKKLQSARAELAKLEAEVAAQRAAELGSLPAQYGFGSVAEFISAVRMAGGKRRGRKPGRQAAGAGAGPGGARGKRRRRSKITDETRASVKKLVS